MNDKLQRIIGQLIPFIVIGISLALIVGLLLLFSYVLIWGILIGCILWLLVIIKNALFPKPQSTTSQPKKSSKGRVIEHHNED